MAVPVTADAHGGTDVAEGGGRGVRIVVQGSDAAAGEVDLSATLAGPGTGDGSKVVYWIRPAGRERAVRIATDRDETGIHHAEIPTGGRGSWRDWDVAAYVTLNTGRRLRVTNDERDPPGPPRVAPRDPVTTSTATAPAPAPSASGDTTENAPSTAVEDVSGGQDGTPGWVVPSGIAVLVLGVLAGVLGRRRRSAG